MGTLFALLPVPRRRRCRVPWGIAPPALMLPGPSDRCTTTAAALCDCQLGDNVSIASAFSRGHAPCEAPCLHAWASEDPTRSREHASRGATQHHQMGYLVYAVRLLGQQPLMAEAVLTRCMHGGVTAGEPDAAAQMQGCVHPRDDSTHGGREGSRAGLHPWRKYGAQCTLGGATLPRQATQI